MNENLNFTPGPWRAVSNDHGASIFVSDVDGHPLNFTINWQDAAPYQITEGRANARLIAAAPKTLQGLIDMRQWAADMEDALREADCWTDADTKHADKIHSRAASVIRKATKD